MHEAKPSTASLAPDEVLWQLSLDEGEHAESLDDLQVYSAARQALFDVVRAVMIGGRDMDVDTLKNIDKLNSVTGISYAYVVSSEADDFAKADLAGRLMYRSAVDLGDLIAKFDPERETELAQKYTADSEDYWIARYTKSLVGADHETQMYILEGTTSALHHSVITELISSRKHN